MNYKHHIVLCFYETHQNKVAYSRKSNGKGTSGKPKQYMPNIKWIDQFTSL